MRTLVSACLLLASIPACASWPRSEPLTPADTGPQASPVAGTAFDMGSWYSQALRWQRDREEALRSETGYLALAGLWWLPPGAEYTFGRDAQHDLVLHDGPGAAGRLVVGDGVVLHAEEGAGLAVDGVPPEGSVRLLADTEEGGPSRVTLGRLTFWVIERGGRLGIRLRDPESAVLAAYTATPRWEPDPAWRVAATLRPFDEPTTVGVPDILGDTTQQPTPGRLEFELFGRPLQLTPTGEPGEDLFVVFGDATSGDESYGGGRFLVVPAPDADGRTILDFNRAYNPPCAYSPYTTCPMPPQGNILPLAVRAGERLPDDLDA